MKIRRSRVLSAAVILTVICVAMFFWNALIHDAIDTAIQNKSNPTAPINTTILKSNFNSSVIQKRSDLTAPRTSMIMKSNRNFLYLTQTESCLSDYLLGPGLFGHGSKRDIVVLSWKQPCSSESSRNLEHIKYIYKESTTWGNGRNILYEFARKLPIDYLYYIFMDDDLKFSFTVTSFAERYRNLSIHWPLQAFEYFLLKHEPAVGLPLICHSDGWCEPVKFYLQPLPEYFPATIWFDAALNAFHKDAVHSLLPYRLNYEHIGWWHSQKYIILAADLYFRGQILKFFAVTMVNNKHRKYPRKNWDNWGDIHDMIKAEMPKRYRDQIKWRPKDNEIEVKPVVRNNTLITPMWTIEIPLEKIKIEPFKHFKP